MFVAEENGRLVATAKINQEQVPEYAEAAWTQDAPPEQVMVLHTLVVDPQAKGRGYGSRFVAFMRPMPWNTAAATSAWTPTSATPAPGPLSQFGLSGGFHRPLRLQRHSLGPAGLPGKTL